MKARALCAEFLGTALLVFFGVGVATLSFGFKLYGQSYSAGVITTAFAFGLVLLALVYAIGPISGCHVNPAVTIGFLLSKRMSLADAIGFWVAQFAGGIAGAALLEVVMHASAKYQKSYGLGTNGYGVQSHVGLNGGGAFLLEVVLTFLFVLAILAVTHHAANATIAGFTIGFALVLVHLLGIAFTGTSVNPARSLGPAIFVGGAAISQVWLFIVAPLVGGVCSALVYRFFYPVKE